MYAIRSYYDEYDRHHLDRRRVPIREARIVRGHPAERHGRERVHDGVEPVHPGQLHRKRTGDLV